MTDEEEPYQPEDTQQNSEHDILNEKQQSNVVNEHKEKEAAEQPDVNMWQGEVIISKGEEKFEEELTPKRKKKKKAQIQTPPAKPVLSTDGTPTASSPSDSVESYTPDKSIMNKKYRMSKPIIKRVKKLELDKAKQIALNMVDDDSHKSGASRTESEMASIWTPPSINLNHEELYQSEFDKCEFLYSQKRSASPSISPKFKHNMQQFSERYKLISRRRPIENTDRTGILDSHDNDPDRAPKEENGLQYSLISSNPHQVYMIVPALPSIRPHNDVPFSFKKTIIRRAESKQPLPHELMKAKPKIQLMPEDTCPLTFQMMRSPNPSSKALMFHKDRYKMKLKEKRASFSHQPISARLSKSMDHLSSKSKRPFSASLDTKRSLEGYFAKNEKHLEQRNIGRNVLRDAPTPELAKNEYLSLQDFNPHLDLQEISPSRRSSKTPPFIEITGQQRELLYSPTTSRDEHLYLKRIESAGNTPKSPYQQSDHTSRSSTTDKPVTPKKNRVTFKQANVNGKSVSILNLEQHTQHVVEESQDKFIPRKEESRPPSSNNTYVIESVEGGDGYS